VVTLVMNSEEAHQRLVESYYHRFLDRTADSSGLTFHVGLWQQGMGEAQVLTSIVASAEYFSRLPLTTEPPPAADTAPPVIVAGLAHDTAPGGGTNTDGVTSDPAVSGGVQDTSLIIPSPLENRLE
jgi:hypothetical protein